MDFKKLNEKLEKYIESNLPEFQKMDKLCDLDKHLSESGRYIGMKDSKYGIYRYVRTTQKFDGSWNYDYKLISPEFDEELDAIDWLAQDLLSNNTKEDLEDCIKEGSFKIYNDNLKTIMDLDVEEGTLDTNPKFPTGDNKGIDPVPNYMLEPNKAKANNLRRDYVQTHGKTYESLNKELQKFVEDKTIYKKLCNLYVSKDMERHLGKDENGYAIFAWDKIQKFGGTFKCDWVRHSPYFPSEEKVIQWYADGLLEHIGMKDIIEDWKDGEFKIYDERLLKLLKLGDIEPGKYKKDKSSASIWPSGEVKDRLVPTYLTMPKGPQRNNARIEYIKQHGKPSELEESLNEKVPTWAEGGPLLVPVEEKPKEKKDYEKRIDEIRQEIADILKDVPESEDVPKTVKEGWGDSIEKWIKVEFTSEAPWNKEWIDKVDYAWFGVVKPDSTHFKPLVLCSKNRDYHLNGGGWDYFSCKWSDDKRWLPIMEDALKAIKAKFGK